MTRAAAVDVQALLQEGYTPCSRCRTLARPGTRRCTMCGSQIVQGDASPTAVSSPAAAPRSSTVNKHLGSLADLPGRSLSLVVHGRPVSQGSLRAVAPGVVKRERGPDLDAWRNAITTEALRVCTRLWKPADTAVVVDLVFTVPAPKRLTGKARCTIGYRDLDKLARAVGDALCPNDPDRFRVIASDMRIVGYSILAKTYPRPHHTHPLALEKPGVFIRVTDGSLAPEPVETDDGWVLQTPCPDLTRPLASTQPISHGRTLA